MNIDAIINVLANVAFTIERKRVSLDRAFTLVCRRVKCSTKEFSREDIYNIAHKFISNYYFVKYIVEKIKNGKYSYRLLARAFLFLFSEEIGIPRHAKLRKTIKRDLPELERIVQEISDPWITLSYPRWFYEKLEKVLNREEVNKLLNAMNRRTIWLRINTLKIDIDKALKRLEYEGVVCEIDKSIPIIVKVLKSPKPVRNLKLVREGAIIIQDKASVLTVLALKPEPNMLIYDFAAAPGIKTSLIMQLTENRARVIAFDLSLRRLINMRKLLKKYGVDIDRVDIALTDSKLVSLTRKADIALVDAPCSSSGAIPKDPAIKLLLRSEKIVSKMSEIQKGLCMNATKYSDTVVYATCSVFPDEGEDVVQYIIHRSDFKVVDPRIPAMKGYRVYSDIWSKVCRTYPHIDDCEGFFIARLER